MVLSTLLHGVGLIVLGVVTFVGSGADTVTLFPVLFGVALASLGLLGQRRRQRRLEPIGQAAALVALLGLAGALPALADGLTLLQGGDVDEPWVVASRSLMVIILAGYLLLRLQVGLDERMRRRRRQERRAAKH